jgi:hypothetical protein
MEMAVQAGLVALIFGVTYAVISEGLWGAALVFLNLLFSTLIALNFYEPVAKLIADNASALAPLADLFALGGIWVLCLFLLKLATDNLAPTQVRFPPLVYQIARLVFGLGAGVLTTAMVMLLLQVAPVHKKLFNAVDPESSPPFGAGLDQKLIMFFSYTTKYTFPPTWGAVSEKDENPRIFDPTGTWISNHKAARPHGEANTPAAAAAPPAGGGGGGNPGASS